MNPGSGLTLWTILNGVIALAALYLIYRYLVKPLLSKN